MAAASKGLSFWIIYRQPFVFIPAYQFGIRCSWPVPEDVFLTLELRAEALVAPGGLVSSAGRIPVRAARIHGKTTRPRKSKAIVEGRKEAKTRANDLRQVQKESTFLLRLQCTMLGSG
jgi:hypothetical protein